MPGPSRGPLNSCGALGQLLVWEWQSESYVLKQQGHADNVAALAFSGDGQVCVCGSMSMVCVMVECGVWGCWPAWDV
jgi:hypothetical protein